MNAGQLMSDLMRLMAGIGVFLMACEIMSKNLEAISSDRLKKLFSRVSGSKLIGVMIGALATVAIQSSSATTVMTIGFVNAGIISLRQAATIIFGGEIGTTITGQIVALGMFSEGTINANVVFSSLAGIGVFTNMFAKKDKYKLLGNVMAGLGMLFVGLSIMSSSMNSFAESEELRLFLARIDSVVLLIIIGALLTALIQSSSAMTSIAITMVVTGLINIEQGIYMTLGANVGTCLTGMLAGMKSESANARRTSLIQLIFNIGGVLLVLIIDLVMKAMTGNTVSFGIIFENMFPGLPHTQLAMFHTIFNIASVVLVLPVSDLLVDLTVRLIPDDEEVEEGEHFYYVDENMIATPAIAVEQVKKEVVNMAKIAMENFNIASEMITDFRFDRSEELLNNEKELNFLNRGLMEIVVKLTGTKNINRKDHLYLTSTYRAISDLERIGDYSQNIMEYAKILAENGESFSEDALKEVKDMIAMINRLYECSMEVYESGSHKAMKEAYKLEEKIDKLSRRMASNHIKRLNVGTCSATTGTQYLKFANDAERIGDHLININDKDYVIGH